jgi:hypothetical protein
MTQPQTLANHHRYDPWYHFVAFGLLLVAFVLSLIHLRHGWSHNLWQVIVTFAMLVVWSRVRIYALRVQDRIIRLEETLRLNALLPDPLKARIQELKPGQFVALRFASDAELPARVQEALDEHLAGPAIKQRIQVWRPDTFRV